MSNEVCTLKKTNVSRSRSRKSNSDKRVVAIANKLDQQLDIPWPNSNLNCQQPSQKADLGPCDPNKRLLLPVHDIPRARRLSSLSSRHEHGEDKLIPPVFPNNNHLSSGLRDHEHFADDSEVQEA